MSCCCTKIYLGFCTVNPCANFDTGLTAQTAGEHILKFSFLNTDYQIKKTFLQGDALIFPLAGLNESAEVIAQIKDPAGDILVFVFETVEYDCFILKTQINYTL